MKKLYCMVVILFLAVAGAASCICAMEKPVLGGYYKSHFIVYSLPSFKSDAYDSDSPPLGSVSNRLRFGLGWRLSSTVRFDCAYDFAPRVQDQLLFYASTSLVPLSARGYRLTDLDTRLYPAEDEDVASFAVFQNLDRLLITVHSDLADFYVGRQAISFGSARVVNPIDVIAPYSYATLDTEDRLGVDALRVRKPLGFMGEIDAGYVFGDDGDFSESAAFLRTRFYLARTDVALLAVAFRENLMLGFDLARSVGGAGVWLEAAHVFVNAFGDDTDSFRDYLRVSVGVDYNLGANTYGFIEYHLNQAGSDDAEDYLDRMGHPAYTEGAVYLVGRHYLAPGFSRQITPLLNLSFQLLCNVTDPSGYLAPCVEYNLAEDVYLAGGAYLSLGKSPETSYCLRSEFGTYPDTYYSSFRVYF